MKILVPTDFSKLSRVAIDYAVDMAKKIGAQVVLLQVIATDAPSRVTMATHRLHDAVKKSSEAEMERLMKELRDYVGDEVKISTELRTGSPIHKVIENFAGKNDVNLIVMGTKGATGLKKALFGSNAAAVMENSAIPVIAIPEKARFRGVKNTVLAFEAIDLSEQLRELKPLMEAFMTNLHLLHVFNSSTKDVVDVEDSTLQLKRAFKNQNLTITVLQNEDVVGEIEDYCADINADLLALFTRKHGIFDKLFSKSVGRELAMHAKIPLLALAEPS